jgi:S-adenosylmethionine:tRNA ribosyltransferase-isomerase
MRLSDFDYTLPPELIAQYPLKKRDISRLLVLDRQTGEIKHCVFKDIVNFLNSHDLLVLNDTKVFKARIFGRRDGFKGKIEILICNKLKNNIYEVLARPCKKLSIGTKVIFNDKRLNAEVLGRDNDYLRMRFNVNGSLYSILDEIGTVPLPPYIKRSAEEDDAPRYQTVYAKHEGAIAAPTAGLHFTKNIISWLREGHVNIAPITLHVGYGTFKPVQEDDITKHNMHKEYYAIPDITASLVNKAKASDKKVIAVGTTVCRALETAAIKRNTFSCQGQNLQAQYGISYKKDFTNIFIYPGYDFKIVDMLLTNFHLPKTTLLMLVSAFAGRENILSAYQEAIRHRYRFFSYGDAMLIV